MLKGALVLTKDVIDLEGRQKRNTWIVYGLTALFSLMQVAWLTAVLLLLGKGGYSPFGDDYLVNERFTTVFIVFSLYNVNNVMSASVMIFSIIYLRWKVNKLETKVVSSR